MTSDTSKPVDMQNPLVLEQSSEKARKVLIVDDEYYIRQVISIVLKRAGYEVIEAVNGKDALDKLKGRKVELIITDLRMPEMDGFGLIERIQQDDSLRLIPVVLMTAASHEIRKQDCVNSGVREYLVKPFISRQIEDIVTSITS